MLNGIDISEYQSPCVDFGDAEFVIVRSSYGVGEQDCNMKKHADRVLGEGRLLGFYHYAYPDCGNSGRKEALSMVSAVKPYSGKCLLCLDWEGNAVSYPVSWILEFMKTIENETGVTPLFYTYAGEAKKAKYSSVAARYPLWVAHWGVNKPVTGQWKSWTIWQRSGDSLDLNIFNGTKANWKSFCEGGESMTKEQFAAHMTEWLSEQGEKPVSSWASQYVDSVQKKGLMVGDASGRFRPQCPVTRQELAVVVDKLSNA